MRNWTKKSSLQAEKNSPANILDRSVTQAGQSPTKVLIMFILLLFCSSRVFAAEILVPYQAVYSSNFSGISVEMKQLLTLGEREQWQLRNDVSIAFIGFSEEALFTVSGLVIEPQRYTYTNVISSKRSSDLRFNREQGIVIDSLHSGQPLSIADGALDKLSFQIQLRSDLLQAGNNFTEKSYTLVDRTKLKKYTVKKIADEIIETPIGTFHTTKLEQRRPGKTSYTLIWTAKELDHFIVRIQPIDKDGGGHVIHLKSLTVGDKEIIGK